MRHQYTVCYVSLNCTQVNVSASPHTAHRLPHPTTGRPRGAAHSAEEMDVLPQSQASVLRTRAQLRLQRGARRLHPEGARLEGHGHLRRLHLPVVSDLI